jgi:hypothetical protein
MITPTNGDTRKSRPPRGLVVCLAATLIFAIMALLTAILGGPQHTLCSAAQVASL